jgi:hypothetical protein
VASTHSNKPRPRRSLPGGDLFAQGARLFGVMPGLEGVAIAGLAAGTPFAELNCDFFVSGFANPNIWWCGRQ